MIASVFVSRPAALSSRQQETYRAWCAALASWELELRTLERSQYTNDPWTALTEQIGSVDGVVVFGFRQPSGRVSPWMQIEAALGIAAGLCVLALPEPVVDGGVFDPMTWGGHVIGRQLCDGPDDACVAEFATIVKRRAFAATSAG